MPVNERVGSKVWFATASGFVGILLGIAVGTVGVKTGFGPLKISVLCSLLAAGASLISTDRYRIATYRPSKFEIVTAIFIAGLICIELYNAITLKHPPRFDIAIQTTSYLMGFVAARLAIRDNASKIAFLQGLVLLAPLSALIGVLQLLEFSPVVRLVIDLTESSGALGRIERNATTRATGLIGHWTGYGGYLLVMVLAYFMMHTYRAKKGSGSGGMLTLNISILGLGVLSTLTLSVISSFAIVVLVYLWATRRLGIIALYALSAVLVGLSIFGTFLETRLQEQFGYNPGALAETNGLLPETLAYRLNIWSGQTIPAILERPFTGWGQGFYSDLGEWHTFPSYIVWPSPESQWLLILVNAGVVGLMLFILPLAQIMQKMRREEGALRAVLMAFAVVSIITSLTVPLFTNAGLPAAFVCLFAVLYAHPEAVSVRDPQPTPQEAPSRRLARNN